MSTNGRSDIKQTRWTHTGMSFATSFAQCSALLHLLVALLHFYSHVFQRLLLPPVVVLANAIVQMLIRNGMMQTVGAACARLRHVSHGTSEYVALRKAYKSLIRRKQRAHQRMAEQDLCTLADQNPRTFWNSYKERQAQHNNISWPAWKDAL